MVYVYDNMNEFTNELFAAYMRNLPGHQLDKVGNFHFLKDKKLSVVAWLLLMHGLKREYGLVDFEITYGKFGKPYLKDFPHIFFNISHCEFGAACAISENEVGLDMEGIGVFDLDVAAYICSQQELKEILKSKQKAKDFCRLWVRKESILKLSGTGITDDFKNVLTLNKSEVFFYEQDNYMACATFSQTPKGPLEFIKVNL